MNSESGNPYELDDEAFDALEALLTSDAVPEDCMNLEMLDGYLAAVVTSPIVIPQEDWLPGVWTAHADGAAFGSGSAMQQAIRLVLSYYNELATSIGTPDGWEPFCYAASDNDAIEIGEEWMEGFAQGLELWPGDWRARVPLADADAVCALLDALVAPWENSGADTADETTRLRWIEDARDTLGEVVARWQAVGLPRPQPVPVEASGGPRTASESGRNDPCPCGSGKKYKKCCGAE
jgi:uncharacterized protein